MGNVVFTLGEHEKATVLVHDAHILDPGFGEYGVCRVTRPVNAISRGGMAERHRGRVVTGVACVPEVKASINAVRI